MAKRSRELQRRIDSRDAYSAMHFVTVGDCDWQRQNIAAVAEWLGAEDGYWRPTAALAARAHPWAADWLHQAPCLLPIIRDFSYSPFDSAVYAKWLFETFRRPRDMVAAAGVAPQFIALAVEAVHSVRAELLQQISAVLKPSDIAQIIPKETAAQQDWLRFCQMFREPIERRVPNGKKRKAELVAWAAKAMARADFNAAACADQVADYVVAHARAFDTGWSWDRAVRATGAWHAEIGAQNADEQKARRLGVTLDQVIDYAPLPAGHAIGPLEFIALQTGRALHAEGAAMRHCVATYLRDVIAGKSRIFSLRDRGLRVATLELARKREGWCAVQLKGRFNRPAEAELKQAAEAFITHCNSLRSKPAKASHRTMPRAA